MYFLRIYVMSPQPFSNEYLSFVISALSYGTKFQYLRKGGIDGIRSEIFDGLDIFKGCS